MTTTTATKTQKICEECGQPGATDHTIKLGDEKLHVRTHKACDANIKARHNEWLASEEGRAALAERAPEGALIYGCDAAGSAWIRANVGLD